MKKQNKTYTGQQKFNDSLRIGGMFCFVAVLGMALFSCKEETPKTIVESSEAVEKKMVKQDTVQKDFLFIEKKETEIQNGEYIKYFQNGRIEMQGILKEGKRDGLWKSYYEDGSPWSETTFTDGKKNGKTTTWYDNKKKRYDGYYTNDIESGKWTFWDETGKIQRTQNY